MDGFAAYRAMDGDKERYARWGRRVVTIGSYSAAAVLLPIALAVLIPIAILRDLVSGTRLGLTRTLILIALVVCCEALGILASGYIWLRYRLSRKQDRDAFLRRNFALQCWWGNALATIGRYLFRVRFRVESHFDPDERPILLLPRHLSFIDALFPVLFISGPHHIMLRYVLKRELLWDPCLDIVGNRLPNLFVRRGGVDTARALDGVAALARDVGANEGVVLFPEGTRFTPERRARLLEKFAAAGSSWRFARAQQLHRVLPPRLSGVDAALSANPSLDVVICAHAGLEGHLSLRALISGVLVGREIRLAFWRIRREEIPAGRREREDWLFEQWRRVDAFALGKDLDPSREYGP